MKKLIAVFYVTILLFGGFFFTQTNSMNAMEVEPSVLSTNAPEM